MSGGDSLTALRVATVAANTMTKNFCRYKELNRCVCDRCRGSGFDSFTKSRSSRKCPRCKGAGSTTVGTTKR